MGSEVLARFADPALVREQLARLDALQAGPLRLMEVCGTHTMALFETGLRPLLAERGIELISGPGCPVCVTAQRDLDHVLALAALPEVALCTFGDMLRVPGTETSLAELKAAGADVRVLYSPADALAIAQNEPERRVVFLAVGFETTTPALAWTVKAAQELGNFYIFPLHKTVPAALGLLAGDPGLRIDGFICPGHVSVVIGAQAYRDVAERQCKPCVITGFEPVDLLAGINALAGMIKDGEARVVNSYPRVVSEDGNAAALAAIAEVFQPAYAEWRGLGVIPGSGLELREPYSRFDARRLMPDFAPPPPNPALAHCRCGEVLAGRINPPECACFGTSCTPAEPLGACMVSQEGACRVYHRCQGVG